MRRGPLLASWAVVLAVSLWFYAVERSMEHFLWHFGYGTAAGMLLGAAAVRRGRPSASPSLWALAGYAYMVVPDVIWIAGRWATGTPVPHAPWMDVFLLHYSLDRWGLAATALVLPAYLGAWAVLGAAQAAARRRASTHPLGAKPFVEKA